MSRFCGFAPISSVNKYIDAHLNEMYSLGIRGWVLVTLLHSQNVVVNPYLYVANWLRRTGRIQQSKYVLIHAKNIQHKLS